MLNPRAEAVFTNSIKTKIKTEQKREREKKGTLEGVRAREGVATKEGTVGEGFPDSLRDLREGELRVKRKLW